MQRSLRAWLLAINERLSLLWQATIGWEFENLGTTGCVAYTEMCQQAQYS